MSNNGFGQMGSEVAHSVSLSDDGNIIALGNPYYNNENGRVRIFEKDPTNTTIQPIGWTQKGLDIEGDFNGDKRFGWSVALSGSGEFIAVGAPHSNGNYGASKAGRIKVYQFNDSNNSWDILLRQPYDLEWIPGANPNDEFGFSVSISKDGSIVSGSSIEHNSTSGYAAVYERVNNNWVQLGNNITDNTNTGAGHSIAISDNGNIIAVGEYLSDKNGSNSGHVSIYQYNSNSSSWEQLGNDIDGVAHDDLAGTSVALSGNGHIVAVGAHDHNGPAGADTGHVRIFQYTNNTWSQLGNDIYGEAPGDRFGYSVNLSTDGTILSANSAFSEVNGVETGHVYLFQYNSNSNSWVQEGDRIYEENSSNNLALYEGSALSGDGSVLAFATKGSTNVVNVHETLIETSNTTSQQSGDICFPAGTPVQTDQGEIAIEKLTSENTIDGVNVVAVVPVYNECDYLVKINKHALGPNYPKKTTLVSRNHRVFVDKKGGDKSVPALALYNGKTVTVVQREEHETIYNVLLPTYSKMTINGLVVETLHPKSVYAKK